MDERTQNEATAAVAAVIDAISKWGTAGCNGNPFERFLSDLVGRLTSEQRLEMAHDLMQLLVMPFVPHNEDWQAFLRTYVEAAAQ